MPFVGALRPKLFISDRQLSPEGVQEVFEYVQLISGTKRYPMAENEAKTIQEVFTQGGHIQVTAQKPGTRRTREMNFYFSRNGERLSLVLYQGDVKTELSRESNGDSTYFSVGATNTFRGADIKILHCRGPFIGRDIDLSKLPRD